MSKRKSILQLVENDASEYGIDLKDHVELAKPDEPTGQTTLDVIDLENALAYWLNARKGSIACRKDCKDFDPDNDPVIQFQTGACRAILFLLSKLGKVDWCLYEVSKGLLKPY